MREKRILILVCCLLTFSVTITRAQNTMDLGTVVVTAARYEQDLQQAAANVSVLTREQILASGATTVPEFLRHLPGVRMSHTGTLKSVTVDLRGFGETASRNVLILLNGRPLHPVDMSAVDLTSISLGAVERIEMLRGFGSVLYGDRAVGGVINIITRKGNGDFSGEISSSYASQDASRVGLEASGQKRGVSYFLASQYTDHPGFRQNSEFLAKDFNARVGAALGEQMDWDLHLGHHNDRQNLPGGLNATQLASLGRQASVTPDDRSWTTDQFFQLTTGFHPFFEDRDSGRLEADVSWRQRGVEDEFNSYGPFHTQRDAQTWGAALKYNSSFEVMDRDVGGVIGVDYYDTAYDILGSGDNVDDLTISKEDFGAYAQTRVELFHGFFASAGTRYQQNGYIFDQRNVPVYQTRTPREWVSSGELKYDYAPGSSVHLGAGQTFRFLATDEWYSPDNFPGWGITPGLNTDLRQQTGLQMEAGVRHQLTDTVTVYATPYWMEIDDEIHFDPVTFANTNLPRTRRLGVEVGQRTDLSRWMDVEGLERFEVFTDYSGVRPSLEKGSNAGKDIPFVARHQLNFGARADIFQRWHVSLFGNYTGSRFPISDWPNNAPKVKARLTLDTRLAVDWKNWEYFFMIKNLTDRKYAAFVSTNAALTNTVFYPEEGRHWEFGAKVNF